MKSSHWTNKPLPLLQAVQHATGVKPRSQLKIYETLKSSGIDFESVVDLGTGKGSWLEAAINFGIDDVRGYDIPEIPVEERRFPSSKFIAADLALPIEVDRKFDLVVSTEVAEHIPTTGVRTFIANLCSLGEFVLFSAATPYQGGMGHCNENWMEYWVGLFKECGFEPYDFLRPTLWNDPEVVYYYKQNLMFFASADQREMMTKAGLVVDTDTKTLIHPDLYLKAVNRSLPTERDRLVSDIEIYYAHRRSLEDGSPVSDFDYGYGAEKLNFASLAKPNSGKARSFLDRVKSVFK